MGIHDNDQNTPNKEFAPLGWRVPNIEDWTTFKEYLISSGYNYDGTTVDNKLAKALASSTSDWWDSWTLPLEEGMVGLNPENNNSTGFNMQPVGYRNGQSNTTPGRFVAEGYASILWTYGDYASNPLVWGIYNYSVNVSFLGFWFSNGFSVRLVKD
jgi:uncharacterized protein (TIGR02145 family)